MQIRNSLNPSSFGLPESKPKRLMPEAVDNTDAVSRAGAEVMNDTERVASAGVVLRDIMFGESDMPAEGNRLTDSQELFLSKLLYCSPFEIKYLSDEQVASIVSEFRNLIIRGDYAGGDYTAGLRHSRILALGFDPRQLTPFDISLEIGVSGDAVRKANRRLPAKILDLLADSGQTHNDLLRVAGQASSELMYDGVEPLLVIDERVTADKVAVLAQAIDSALLDSVQIDEGMATLLMWRLFEEMKSTHDDTQVVHSWLSSAMQKTVDVFIDGEPYDEDDIKYIFRAMRRVGRAVDGQKVIEGVIRLSPAEIATYVDMISSNNNQQPGEEGITNGILHIPKPDIVDTVTGISELPHDASIIELNIDPAVSLESVVADLGDAMELGEKEMGIITAVFNPERQRQLFRLFKRDKLVLELVIGKLENAVAKTQTIIDKTNSRAGELLDGILDESEDGLSCLELKQELGYDEQNIEFEDDIKFIVFALLEATKQ